jgi:hypothetical protein
LKQKKKAKATLLPLPSSLQKEEEGDNRFATVAFFVALQQIKKKEGDDTNIVIAFFTML